MAKVKFVQIAANANGFVAIDDEGCVWVYGLNMQEGFGWSKIESPNQD